VLVFFFFDNQNENEMETEQLRELMLKWKNKFKKMQIIGQLNFIELDLARSFIDKRSSELTGNRVNKLLL